MSVNNTNCCVYGCHSKKGRNRNLSFHSFPEKNKSTVYMTNKFGLKEKVDRYKAWMLKLKMGRPATKFSKVCSLHFHQDDFILPDISSKKPRLKLYAVPSKNLPERKTFYDAKPVKPRRCITLRTQENVTDAFEVVAHKSTDFKKHTQEVLEVADLEETAARALCALSQTHSSIMLESKKDQETQVTSEDFDTKEDKGVQISSGDLVEHFADRIKTNQQLNTMTGIPDYELFNYIVSVCERIFGTFSRKNKLSLKECIMLCLMKIKNRFSYAVLSVLFGTITDSTCRNIFHESVVMLAKVLKVVIYLPPIEEIKMNMPSCFKQFQKVRIVLDCTEIPVQKVKSLKSRLRTYSHYKKGHTLKFMTAVTPAGTIAFVSKAYGGRYSDKAIFEQSGLLEKLEMFRDEIMVDKGFLIHNIAETHFVKVIQPPFLRKQKQFSKSDALSNQKIAKARVHIERVNQRIKIFDIFNTPLPVSLWPRADDLFIIACAIVNLTNSIFNDSRFL